MYDINKRKCLRNATIGDIINELSALPKDVKILCCGESDLYIHVEKDNSTVSIDTEDLDDEYIDDPGTSWADYWKNRSYMEI